MNRPFVLLFVLAALVSPCFAQDAKNHLTHKQPAKKSVDVKAPVTQAEVATVFDRVRGLLQSILSVRTPLPTSIPRTQAPVTRAQVVREMDRLFEASKPAFKFTPTKLRFDATQLSPSDAANRASMQKLIAWGFMAKLGPLATSSKDTIALDDFGDALGFFLSRIAELTHTPSTKWSPYLKID